MILGVLIVSIEVFIMKFNVEWVNLLGFIMSLIGVLYVFVLTPHDGNITGKQQIIIGAGWFLIGCALMFVKKRKK